METNPEVALNGALFESLSRPNSQIKKDRAISIVEDGQVVYQRTVQDLALKIRKLDREVEATLDMSPANAGSLTPAKDFDALAFVSNDIEKGIERRNLEIRLEIAKKRYEYLFGGDTNKTIEPTQPE
jgi:hypothetical protein